MSLRYHHFFMPASRPSNRGRIAKSNVNRSSSIFRIISQRVRRIHERNNRIDIHQLQRLSGPQDSGVIPDIIRFTTIRSDPNTHDLHSMSDAVRHTFLSYLQTVVIATFSYDNYRLFPASTSSRFTSCLSTTDVFYGRFLNPSPLPWSI